MIYECWDVSGQRVCIDADSAEAAARAYVDAGDWVDEGRTVLHTVWYIGPDGDEGKVKVAAHPAEPGCDDDTEHDWQQVKVRGNGGGVVVWERCDRCGWERVTDTWATDPYDGTQGHRAVRYVEATRG